MTTKPADCSLPIGASGVPYDVRCPQCRYNLRGLTVPRCPECGLTFEWSDLERFRSLPESEGVLTAVGIALALLCVVPIVVVAGPPLMVLAFAVAVIFAVAASQTCVEFVIAFVWVGPLYWPRFRVWWEGVLIGYGATAVTWLFCGYGMSLFEGLIRATMLPWLWLLTTVEAIGIQWLVVRRQLRIRNQIPVPSRGLLCACLLAKLVSAILWLAMPVTLVRL